MLRAPTGAGKTTRLPPALLEAGFAGKGRIVMLEPRRLAARAAARRIASERGALATFGKVIAEPGGSNGVPAAVHAWLDARAAAEEVLRETVTTVSYEAEKASAEQGVRFSVRQESATPVVRFNQGLRERISDILGKHSLGDAPVLPTGAGHDAGVLAARVPTAMLFVRNPTGVSHSPAEHADLADCEAGVLALAAVLEELACR